MARNPLDNDKYTFDWELRPTEVWLSPAEVLSEIAQTAEAGFAAMKQLPAGTPQEHVDSFIDTLGLLSHAYKYLAESVA